MKIGNFVISGLLVWMGIISILQRSPEVDIYLEDDIIPAHAQEQDPGLVIQGRVWLSELGCDGLSNVKIYRSFAAYPGEIEATTNSYGYYASDFIYIPGDEMVTVWAELDGYSFEPENYYWRHYQGYRVMNLDFWTIGKSPISRCYYMPLLTHYFDAAQK